MASEFSFEAELFPWDGPAAWVFAALPPDLADVIDEIHEPTGRGFGSSALEEEMRRNAAATDPNNNGVSGLSGRTSTGASAERSSQASDKR